MKRLLVLLSLAWLCFGAYAEHDADSLWNAYQNEKIADTSRINALHYLAVKFQRSRPDSMLYVADLMLQYMDENGTDHAKHAAYQDKAYALMMMGRFNESIEMYRKALPLLKKKKLNKEIAGNMVNTASCYSYQTHYDTAIYYYQQAIAFCEEVGETEYRLNAITNIATVYNNRGEYEQAIKTYKEVIPVAKETGNNMALAGAYMNIGQAYFKQGRVYNALDYYDKALNLQLKLKNPQGQAHALNFIGDAYHSQGEDKAALEKLEESLSIAKEISDINLQANILISLGNVWSNLGEKKKAKEMYEQSFSIAEQIGDARSALVCLNNLAAIAEEEDRTLDARALHEQVLEISRMVNIKNFIAGALIHLGGNYNRTGDNVKAEGFVLEGLGIAKDLGDIDLQWQAANNLVKIYSSLGKSEKAKEMFEFYVQMKDSVHSNENKNATLRREYKFAYEKQALQDSAFHATQQAVKDQEIARRKTVGNGLAIGLGLVLVFALVVFKQRNKIAKEKKLSEELLHNILPEEVAAELKETGEAEAKLINDTTVLFTDFKGFTSISEKLSPKELVADIHSCFSEFDKIMEKYSIEKIKTIGDAYMAAGGLPEKSNSTVKDVIMAAFEIVDFIEKNKQRSIEMDKEFFEIRVGIHTGPVVAGIVGVKKFQYDIWGDTVNTASRMESNGEIGKVNISQYTYDLIKEDPRFTFHHRGKITAKGKGEVDMYFVERRT